VQQLVSAYFDSLFYKTCATLSSFIDTTPNESQTGNSPQNLSISFKFEWTSVQKNPISEVLTVGIAVVQ